jgi:lipopolysaccharide biosynthesis regulator YciM
MDMTKKVQSTDPQKIGAEIAPFYCELAEQELEIDPSRALPLLKTCYQDLNKLPSFQTWLKGILARHPLMVSAHLMLAQVIEVESGTEEAQACLQSKLQ